MLKKPLLIVSMCSLSWLATAQDVVVVVGAGSTIASLDKAQAKDLFLGRPVAVSAGSQAIPLEQAESSETREAFHAWVTGKSSAQLKAYWSKLVFSGKGTPPREAANAAEVRRMLAGNGNLVGYLGKGQVDGSVRVVLAP